MGSMFEKFFSGKKEEPKKPEQTGPSFEEVAMALPENEREELVRLESAVRDLTTEGEGGQPEIDHDFLSEGDKKLLEKHADLFGRARDLFEQNKK